MTGPTGARLCAWDNASKAPVTFMPWVIMRLHHAPDKAGVTEPKTPLSPA